MSAITVSQPSTRWAKSVAPVWHTLVLVAFFLLLTLLGIIFQHNAGSQQASVPPSAHRNVSLLYLTLIAGQWGLLFYVWKGLRRSGTTLRNLVGGRWSGVRDVLVDLSLAIGLWLGWMCFQMAWTRLFGSSHAASISSLLPQRFIEYALWILLSASAGICEEVIFRGYFLRQFAAFTRSVWAGLLLQAILFGVSHGYQGLDATLRITVYGALFGFVCLWRKSLRPGIAAHALTDILAVLLKG